MLQTSRLIWHRGRDLRLHDNELYAPHDHNPNPINNNETPPPLSHPTTATSTATTITSLFIFDDHYFQPQLSTTNIPTYNTIWCGPHATRSLLEAVTSLRNNLKRRGGELLIRRGDPIVIIPRVIQEVGATELVYGEEPGTYERGVSQRLKQLFLKDSSSVTVITKVIYTLYHPDDLPRHPDEWYRLAHPQNNPRRRRRKTLGTPPTSLKDEISKTHDGDNIVNVSPERFYGMCPIMGDFRRATRSHTTVRRPLIPPTRLIKPNVITDGTVTVGIIPTFEELMQPLRTMTTSILGLNREIIESVIDAAATAPPNNEVGEESARERLSFFISKGHAARADRSQADVSNNNSSRFSTPLAFGTLSPRTVYYMAQARSCEGGRNDDGCCRWIMSHLEMRDFFIYTAWREDWRLFRQQGIPLGGRNKAAKNEITWINPQSSSSSNSGKINDDSHDKWRRWTTGETHFPLVDAAMKELISTGYCSNRVRQNAASFLTKDLTIDWRLGAEWFQFLLDDYCVAANWGNWLYFAGVGPDPKNRHFRTISQALRYDGRGEYVMKWLPVLKRSLLSSSSCEDRLEAIFRPWSFGVGSFLDPIVDPVTQLTWQDLERLKDSGRLIKKEEEEEDRAAISS